MGNQQLKTRTALDINNNWDLDAYDVVMSPDSFEESKTPRIVRPTEVKPTQKRFLTPQSTPKIPTTPRQIRSAMLGPCCSFGVTKPTILRDIENWCFSNNFNSLYNSSIDGLSSRSLNSKICCHSNVLIIVMTEDKCVFGCYHQEAICPAQPCQTKRSASQNFFLFTHNHTTVEKMEPKGKQIKEALTIHSNLETNFVLTVSSAFWILTDGSVHIHPSLKNYYSVKSSTLNPLLSGCFNKTCRLSYLLAFECL